MARPKKQVVDYFSHDTDASQKRTLTIIVSKYGITGYGFWFLLLELLGRTPGHFYDFSDPIDWEFMLAKTYVSDNNNAKEMLDTFAMLGAIDGGLYKKGVIWSQNFVERLEDVYRRRKESLPEKPVIDNTITTQTELPQTENPQSKLKETKVNNKENNKRKYGEFKNVLLTDEELQKLNDKFGEGKTKSLIEKLSAYMESKGKRYKSHYATILNWERRNGDHAKTRNSRALPTTYTPTPGYPDD